MRRWCAGWLPAMCLVLMSFGSAAAADPKPKFLMLTQSKGFTHGSVNRQGQALAPAEVAMMNLAQSSGLFELHCTQDAAADFTKQNLQNYKVVMFYTTGDLPIAEADRDYFFKEWLTTEGHGFIGFHSATDTFGNYQPYWDMVGGTFNGHPWNAGDQVTIAVHDPEFPAMAPFGSELVIKDEIYQYKNWQPEKVRVLMSLNMAKCGIKKPYHVPVSWVKNYGKGKVFYTNLGHNESTWTNPKFLEHVTGGVKWVLGQVPGDATPNPELSQQQEAKAQQDASAQE
jgi:uncharacterized protein